MKHGIAIKSISWSIYWRENITDHAMMRVGDFPLSRSVSRDFICSHVTDIAALLHGRSLDSKSTPWAVSRKSIFWSRHNSNTVKHGWVPIATRLLLFPFIEGLVVCIWMDELAHLWPEICVDLWNACQRNISAASVCLSTNTISISLSSSSSGLMPGQVHSQSCIRSI
jgi:hypothetical protein